MSGLSAREVLQKSLLPPLHSGRAGDGYQRVEVGDVEIEGYTECQAVLHVHPNRRLASLVLYCPCVTEQPDSVGAEILGELRREERLLGMVHGACLSSFRIAHCNARGTPREVVC